MESRPTSKPASTRGRNDVPRSLVTGSTASTRAKQNLNATANKPPTTKPLTTKPPTAEKKPQTTLGSSSTTSLKASKQTPGLGKSARTPLNSRGTSTMNPPTKLDAPDLPSLNDTAPPSPTLTSSALAEEKIPTPPPSSDSLQVAAQIYPWMYMTSTLEACFQTAEETANKDLKTKAQQLEEQEYEIADQRIRFDSERAADLYDELATDAFATTAPAIMQAFLSHGDDCTRIEAEALQLATQGVSEPDEDAPLQIYVEMSDSLEELHSKALELESSILQLTEGDADSPDAGSDSAHSQILGVFSACLLVLRARISNLSMALELIDGAQENLSISLRMESLGLLDS